MSTLIFHRQSFKQFRDQAEAKAAAQRAGHQLDPHAPAPTGTTGMDFMEHYNMSTQAVLVSLLHWQGTLGSPVSKASVGIFFDFLVDATMESTIHRMILRDNLRCAEIGIHGVAVDVQLGKIVDATALAEHFTIIQKALGRKKDRGLIVDEPVGANYKGMVVDRHTDMSVLLFSVFVSQIRFFDLLDSGFDVDIKVRPLLMWLLGKLDATAQCLFWGLIFGLSLIINASGFITCSTDDPLDIPDYKGPKGRLMKISTIKKTKVAKIAARGDIFKSGRSVMRGMSILGKCGTFAYSDHSQKNANKWTEPLAFQYLHKLQEVFHHAKLTIPVLSFAWDATRLSKKDTLVTTIYNRELDCAGWCPPQVGMFCGTFCILLWSR